MFTSPVRATQGDIMPISKKVLLTLSVAAATFLSQATFLQAFELIELPIVIDLDLDSNNDFSRILAPIAFPYTGFVISNPGDEPVSLDGASSLVVQTPDELLQQNRQDGFALLDRTLLLEVNATDITGKRAGIITTYRMDVTSEEIKRGFLTDLLFNQGVVSDEGRAGKRAGSMELADARIMRFLEDDSGGGTWVRAVRAITADSIEDIDFRFVPRHPEDGILGHYGNHTDDSGNAYVWAVMDRNSKYAVGFTVDRDDDGVANADDNCVNVTNQDQSNHDDDSLGDACDTDDDNDGLMDGGDNCPLTANEDQSDTDRDGIGNACDADDDNDGLNDGLDQCLETQLDAIVDENGCSIEDTCPCDNEWKNHGAFVRCNAYTSGSFVEDGLITEEEKGETMSLAGQSACGSRK